MAATIFQIENGKLAFSVVDTADVGYADTWQAPNGTTLLTAAIADYDADAATWSCQVTSAALTASPNQNDVTVPATFCQASLDRSATRHHVLQPGRRVLAGSERDDRSVTVPVRERHRGGVLLPRVGRRRTRRRRSVDSG